MIRRLLVILSMGLLSLFVNAAVEKQLLNKLDLKRALFEDQYMTLNVADQDVLVVLDENTNAISRGVAMLVTESNTTLTSKQGLAPLVEYLTKLGWVTMLIPSPPAEFILPREEITENTPALDFASLSIMPANELSQQTVDEHLEGIRQIMQAASEKASEYPGFILVISQGTTAASLTQLYTQKKLPSPDAMIVIGPYWPDRKFNKQFTLALANSTMPVLDLYTDRDNTWSVSNAEARKVAAVKYLKLHYRQKEIIGPFSMEQNAHYISKEVYGWLSHMGW